MNRVVRLSRVTLMSLSAAAVFAVASPARAVTTWDIDPAHSTVGFVVKHLVIAKYAATSA